MVSKGGKNSFPELTWSKSTNVKEQVDRAMDTDGEVYCCKFSPIFNDAPVEEKKITHANDNQALEPKPPAVSGVATSLLPRNHNLVKLDFENSVDKRFKDTGQAHEASKQESNSLKTSFNDLSTKASNIKVQNEMTQSKSDVPLERLPLPASSSSSIVPPATPP